MELLLQQQRQRVNMEYDHAKQLAELDGKMIVYRNQDEAARRCLAHFEKDQ